MITAVIGGETEEVNFSITVDFVLKNEEGTIFRRIGEN